MAKTTSKSRVGKQATASRPRATRDERYATGKALRDRVASCDALFDVRITDRDVLSRVDRRCMEALVGDRGRNRYRSLTSLVLVAHQCMVGSVSDVNSSGRFAFSAVSVEMGQ